MRFVKFMVVAAFVLSLVLNWVLYQKSAQRRVQVSVNDKPIRKKDFDDFLEQHHGREAMAQMIRYELIMQAAEKAGIKIDENEIEKQLNDLSETNPKFAWDVKYRPWAHDDTKQDLELNEAWTGLTIKDVQATDDELRSFFTANPGKWDKPDKVYIKAIACQDQATADKAKQLMENVTDMTVIAQQLAGQSAPVGADGTWVITKPVGAQSQDARVNMIAAMSERQVIVTDLPNMYIVYRIINLPFTVIRREKIVPGKKMTYDEVKDKVARDFKLSRSTPPQETLRKLWDEANIQTDDPNVKADIERLLFPEREDQRRTAEKQ